MAEFINLMTHVKVNTVSDNKDNEGMDVEDGKVSLISFIDDKPIMDNKPSDYYGFTNVSQTYSTAEEDAYSESDIRNLLDEKVKAKNYSPNPEASDSESDNDDFKDVKQYIEKFRESSIVSHGIDSLDQSFSAVCYAFCCEKLQKIDKCSNDELRTDLAKDLFDQMNAIKTYFGFRS